MNKLAKDLVKDAKGIMKQRANILAETTKEEQDDLVREIQKRKRDLEIRKLNLTDLSPDNTYSLRPGGNNYDAKKWVKEMQEIKVALLNVEVELEAALSTTEEWFKDFEEDEKAS